MTFEMIFHGISTWLGALNTAIAQKNAQITDGVELAAPRERDVVVTFLGDSAGQPDQCPAVVVEIAFGQDAVNTNVAQFHGTIHATLYLVDDATSVEDARLKISRWADVIRAHCNAPSAFVGGLSKIRPQHFGVRLGRRNDLSAGDMNVFEVQTDLEISV